MHIGLFSLQARSISCCVKRSRFFFTRVPCAASGQEVAGGQLFVPGKMNCVFVRGLAAVFVLLSASAF